jgi:hypothetical protein
MLIPSLLAAVTPADIRTDPFPHIVRDDALDPALYERLSAEYPPTEMFMAPRASGHPYPSNSRYEFAAWIAGIHAEVGPLWKEFVRRHSEAAFLAEVFRLFDGHWPAALRDALGGSFGGHSTGRRLEPLEVPPRIWLDARAEINTPVHGTASVSRGPHLDTPNRLYSGLYYFRHPQDDSEGGELHLYRWKNGPQEIGRFQQPDEAVELALTIPYRANRFVLFPQGLHALHGVGERPPTPHVRRYVFITVELETPWLQAPETARIGA